MSIALAKFKLLQPQHIAKRVSRVALRLTVRAVWAQPASEITQYHLVLIRSAKVKSMALQRPKTEHDLASVKELAATPRRLRAKSCKSITRIFHGLG